MVEAIQLTDWRIKPAAPLTEAEALEIENELGRKLPEDYRSFVMEFGGAFVGGLVGGSTDLPVLRFFGMGDRSSLLRQLQLHSDFKADGVLPIADCELGNLYVIDLNNEIHYVNYYGGRTTTHRVASSFREFLHLIGPEED